MQVETELEVSSFPSDARPSGDQRLLSRHRSAIKTPLGVWWAALLAGLALACINALAITRLPHRQLEDTVRLQHYLFDAGQQLGFAWLLAASLTVYQRGIKPWLFRRATWTERRLLSRWLPFGSLTLGLCLLLWPTLSDDFLEFSHRHTNLQAAPYLAHSMTIASAGALAGALVLLTRFWRPWLAVAAALVSVALLSKNHEFLSNNYPGVHFLIALAGLSGLLAAIKPWRFSPRAARRWGRWFGALLPILCLPAFVIPPSRTLLVEQLKLDGSVIAPQLTQLRQWLQSVAYDASQPHWVESTERESVASSQPELLPEKPLVILLTVDAVRADVLNNPTHLSRFKTLRQLKRKSVYFANARAPGSQTVTSLSGIFSGLYFSQQYWSRHPEVGHLFLGDDEPARFPEVLQQAGIKTVTFSATYFLLNRFGVVRGFDEERFLDNPGQPLSAYSPGSQLTDHLLKAIDRDGHRSLFLYAHYLDTHFPYQMGGNRGTPFERYLESIAYVDRQIQRVVSRLRERGLWERTLLVIASDHGEAFGEHNSKFHATTLYEEQLRVPLLFHAQSLEPRVVETPVSLMDLGPTLLDLLGLPTPAHFMGQSLVPLLRGESLTFTRRLAAEGRLKKALFYPDGYKLIVDDHHHTVELYDLDADPKELRNLIDDPDSRGSERLAELRQFFETHSIRRPGYQIPYRP